MALLEVVGLHLDKLFLLIYFLRRTFNDVTNRNTGELRSHNRVHCSLINEYFIYVHSNYSIARDQDVFHIKPDRI